MGIVGSVGGAIQSLLGKIAEKAGEETKVILRQRVFTSITLAQTFVLSFLQKPDATDEDIAEMAALCGAGVTPQAICKRHSPALVKFLQTLFAKTVHVKVEADKTLAPILERFTKVIILDSSTITLPDDQQEEFTGCGGSYHGGKAALKLQVELDLRSGSLAHVELEPGKSPDSATTRQETSHGPGSLRITDLGYFNVPVFAAMDKRGEYFLSRLNFGTKVAMTDNGPMIDIMEWLRQWPTGVVDQTIWLGCDQRLKCRVIAFRVPPEVAAERRRKLRHEAMRKRGCEPTAARLAWCDWTILVTNVPESMLRVKEAIVLYRARWQVELLFKRWKSQDLIAELTGTTTVRQMVRVWARLIAAVLQHWLLLSSVWGDPTKSLGKAVKAIRRFVTHLVVALDSSEKLQQVLHQITKLIAKTCRRNKRRKKPGTFELLNNAELLDFTLS
jgi:hypothetical protein